MFWRRCFMGLVDPAAMFRRTHEAWLNRALTSGRSYPRIPLRRVDRGGFEHLRTRPGGARRAERWWDLALARVDSDPA